MPKVYNKLYRIRVERNGEKAEFPFIELDVALQAARELRRAGYTVLEDVSAPYALYRDVETVLKMAELITGE